MTGRAVTGRAVTGRAIDWAGGDWAAGAPADDSGIAGEAVGFSGAAGSRGLGWAKATEGSTVAGERPQHITVAFRSGYEFAAAASAQCRSPVTGPWTVIRDR